MSHDLIINEGHMDCLNALRNAKIRNGELIIDSKYQSKLMEISEFLREALYAYAIPHYRVVGIKVYGCDLAGTNFLSKLNGIDASYHDLMIRTKDLIYAEVGSVDIPYVQSSFIPVDATNGVLFGVGLMSTADGNDGIVTPGEGRSPKALVPNQYISTTSASNGVFLLFSRGTGMKDFTDNQKYCKHGAFIPMRAIFELNSLVAVRGFQHGDKCIKLTYKQVIREDVLEKIIQDFANDYL